MLGSYQRELYKNEGKSEQEVRKQTAASEARLYYSWNRPYRVIKATTHLGANLVELEDAEFILLAHSAAQMQVLRHYKAKKTYKLWLEHFEPQTTMPIHLLTQAYRNLAYLQLHRSQPNYEIALKWSLKAIETTESASSIPPELPLLKKQLATIYLGLKNYPEAKKLLDSIIADSAPSNPLLALARLESLAYLGRLHLVQGQTQLAEQRCSEALGSAKEISSPGPTPAHDFFALRCLAELKLSQGASEDALNYSEREFLALLNRRLISTNYYRELWKTGRRLQSLYRQHQQKEKLSWLRETLSSIPEDKTPSAFCATVAKVAQAEILFTPLSRKSSLAPP